MPGVRPLEHHLPCHARRGRLFQRFPSLHVRRAALPGGCPDPFGHGANAGTPDEADPCGMDFPVPRRESAMAGRPRTHTLGQPVRRFGVYMPDGFLGPDLGGGHRAVPVRQAPVRSPGRIPPRRVLGHSHSQHSFPGPDRDDPHRSHPGPGIGSAGLGSGLRGAVASAREPSTPGHVGLPSTDPQAAGS